MKKSFFICLVILLHSSFAFAKFDPSFTWTTLETPHFYIHYHQGVDAIAKRAAVIAEDVHERLVPRIKWKPTDKTHLVLVDALDEANGWASPFPYNHMTLYLTQPLGAPGFGTTSYDEWLRLVITHEYAHILHLDMIYGGLGKVMQTIFGRLYFPNMWQSLWLIEGLAVYEETEQTSGGRGRSPGADMVLRMAALEGPFPSPDQAAVFPDSWPSGQVPYLFGESFTRYIVEKYGRDKLAEISTTYSGRGFPFLVDSTGLRVLLRSYNSLWFEWEISLKERYRTQEEKIRSQGITTSAPLTKKGYYAVHPAYSPDGKRIAYTVLNADEFPGIYIMNSDGTGDRKLVSNAFSTSASGACIAWDSDGSGIFYTKLDMRRNTNLYNDMYYYDLKNDKEIRLSSGLRARDPFPSPDGKRLIFVTNKLGKTRLATAALPADRSSRIEVKDIVYLTEESANQFETPRFSPDGSMIVAGVWQPGGYKDVWLLDAQGKKIEELMHDRAIDGNAAWSRDGKAVYFSSDRTGIFNIFAYSLETKMIYQVTNVLGGAFTPASSPDGRTIAFSNYSARGFDLHLHSMASTSWKPAEPYKDPHPVISYSEKPVETTTRSYNPLPTLLPRFWLPWLGYSKESGVLGGFFTAGQDAIQRHTYLATGLYGPKNDRFWYSFFYSYDGLYPTFNLWARDIDAIYGDLLSDAQGTKNYTERSQMIDVSLVFPLLTLERRHSLLFGYRRTNVGALTSLPPWPGYSGPVPAQGTMASGRAQYIFNSAKRFDFSISPEDGRTIELGYERLDKALGSDFEVRKYTADWHEYLPFFWKHHVLLARGFYGISEGEVIPQRAFQLGGDNPGDLTIPLDQEAVYLRGYPINAFRGRNAALASLEYRFPIRNIERGVGNGPLFLRRFHGAVFAESGNAWDESLHIKDFKSSVGAEARLDMYLAYYLPITLRIGVAQGLDEKRETTFVFGIWAPLLY